MIAGARFTKAAVVALVLGVGVTSPCLADPYVLTYLENVAVYGFSPSCGAFHIQLQSPATIHGNIGVRPLADLTLGGADVTVSGKVYYIRTLTTSGSGDDLNASGGPIYMNGQPPCNSDATCSDASRGEDQSPLVRSASTDQWWLYGSGPHRSATAQP